MNKNASIQALRALSILLVILLHAREHYALMGGSNAYLKVISNFGFIGVDIFFVISGFVIYGVASRLPQTPDNAVRFLKTRMVRVFPFYWMILPFYAYATLWLDKRTVDIVGSGFLLQPDTLKLIMNVSWTLTYELAFYLMMTFCFLLRLSVIRLFSIHALAIILNHYFHGNAFLLNPLFLEFYIGMLIAWGIGPLERRIEKNFLRVLIALTCACLALGLLYTVVHRPIAEGGLARVSAYGPIGGALVIAALFLDWGRSKLLSVIPTIGDASFAIYLWHVFILQMCYESGLLAFFSKVSRPGTGLLTLFLINILIGIAWYRFIEHPVYLKLKTRIGRTRNA